MGHQPNRGESKMGNTHTGMTIKTYSIALENGKYNTHYLENGVEVSKEFHSLDGADRREIMILIGYALIDAIKDLFATSGLTTAVKTDILNTCISTVVLLSIGFVREARVVCNATGTTVNFTAGRKAALLNIIDTALSRLP